LIIIYCKNCGFELKENTKFCHSCGYSLNGLKGRIDGYRKRITYQSKELVETFRGNLSNQISNYLSSISKGDPLKIKGITVPDNQRETVRRALESFQNRFGTQINKEVDHEFQEWLNHLPDMLEDQKCVVCFIPWNSGGRIVVCKYCKSGGHKNHIEDWVNQKGLCPLCRQTIKKSDLYEIDTPEL
jgi:hypothetical protein